MLLTKENRIFVKAVLIRKSYTSAICFQINIDDTILKNFYIFLSICYVESI